jgi:hypothetical protein
MTKAQDKAYRLRRTILVGGILFTIAGIVWAILPLLLSGFDDCAGLFGTPLIANSFAGNCETFYCVNVIFVFGIILLAQWGFLRPSKGWAIQTADVGKPLKTSVFAAALMATFLTTGFISLLLEFPNWWEVVMGKESDSTFFNSLIVWAVMLLIWSIWSWVFFVYWRQGDRYTRSGKMIRGLVAGSVLETIIAVPVHIWATRQRECYCCRGTYTTLVLSATVLIWAFGPGIILLYMREKRRVEKLNALEQE